MRHAAGDLTPGGGTFRFLKQSQILKNYDYTGIFSFFIRVCDQCWM